MKDIISKKVERLAPSGIRAFFDLVLGMKDVISLGVGEPDFVTPWNIRETGIYSLEQGYTSYTSNKGLYKLRLLLSRNLKQRYSLTYSAEDQILVTVGVSDALDLVMRAIINPGDEVIIPLPSYVSYAPVVELAGGKAVFLPGRPERGFKFTPEDLERLCTKKTKAILLNYPANPTGVSYTKSELLKINRVCKKNGLIVITDEVYSELSYDFAHTPFPVLPGARDYTVYLNGFSKSYAMTGWRLGYACGPKKIIAAMTKIHQYTILCAPIVGQMSACEAVVAGKRSVEEMKKEYKRRRDFMVESLNGIGLETLMPQGAFYVFPRITGCSLNSLQFAEKLLKQEKVAVVPGVAFGKRYDRYLRMSYAAAYNQLKQAVKGIKNFMSRNKSK